MAASITKEFKLPSCGILYGKAVKWENVLRAPRLCDRGFGEIVRKNKLQASILDKTIVEPLGMSTYDLHPADFIYLNFIQRQLLKGDAPYKVEVLCKSCGKKHSLDISIDSIEIKPLKAYTEPVLTLQDGTEVTVTYTTPRILDSVQSAVDDFKETYPDADTDVETQELLRKIIVKVNGEKMSYAQMTSFIQNLLITSVEEILEASITYDWGVQLLRKHKCDACGRIIMFNLPV